MKTKIMGPGILLDENGDWHICIPDILEHCKIPDTPENRDKLTERLAEMTRKAFPQANVEVRD